MPAIPSSYANGKLNILNYILMYTQSYILVLIEIKSWDLFYRGTPVERAVTFNFHFNRAIIKTTSVLNLNYFNFNFLYREGGST